MFSLSTINRSKTSKRKHNYKQHQNMKHSNGKLVKPPEMKQQRNGSQILVPDNNDCDNACYVTIHVYHIGVVLIQGRGCATWEVDDMPDISLSCQMSYPSHVSLTLQSSTLHANQYPYHRSDPMKASNQVVQGL